MGRAPRSTAPISRCDGDHPASRLERPVDGHAQRSGAGRSRSLRDCSGGDGPGTSSGPIGTSSGARGGCSGCAGGTSVGPVGGGTSSGGGCHSARESETVANIAGGYHSAGRLTIAGYSYPIRSPLVLANAFMILCFRRGQRIHRGELRAPARHRCTRPTPGHAGCRLRSSDRRALAHCSGPAPRHDYVYLRMEEQPS